MHVRDKLMKSKRCSIRKKASPVCEDTETFKENLVPKDPESPLDFYPGTYKDLELDERYSFLSKVGSKVAGGVRKTAIRAGSAAAGRAVGYGAGKIITAPERAENRKLKRRVNSGNATAAEKARFAQNNQKIARRESIAKMGGTAVGLGAGIYNTGGKEKLQEMKTNAAANMKKAGRTVSVNARLAGRNISRTASNVANSNVVQSGVAKAKNVGSNIRNNETVQKGLNKAKATFNKATTSVNNKTGAVIRRGDPTTGTPASTATVT